MLGMIGPFMEALFEPWFQRSPMMTRPKKDSTEKRIIIDLSYPRGLNVNAGIVKGFYLSKLFNFSLPSISTLADRLLLAGVGAWFWTADLSRAYLQLRVCPLSTPLLGISVDKVFVDIAPPFGGCTSALAYARATRAVV